MAHPRVSTIIVTFNSKDEIAQCLDSLQHETVPMEIFVVDNASDIGFREFLGTIKLPNLKVILNEQNVGLTRAENEPMNECSGEYILMLNPDTVIGRGAVDSLVSYLDANPAVGVVAPRIFSGDGSTEWSFRPANSTWNLTKDTIRGWIKVPAPMAWRRGRAVTINGTEDVLFATGACLLIRKELFLKLGGYDPNFFLAVEDVVDFCMRVWQSGYRVVYYPSAQIVHWGGRSHSGFLSIFWGYQGHLYYQLKYASRASTLLLRVELFVDAMIEIGIMIGPSMFNWRRRLFLLAYTFAAAKLLTHSTDSLLQDGLELNAMLSAKSKRLAHPT
jgi:N-acetylglucosaminyl-diphospho-decaprenol L-rhamnosyltransferase